MNAKAWTVTLNSRDNYSDRVPDEEDNVGTPIEPVNIEIDMPMFPLRGRFPAAGPAGDENPRDNECAKDS